MGRRRLTSRELKKINKTKWGLYKWRVSKDEIRKIRMERESR
jgi:hypothetical protein